MTRSLVPYWQLAPATGPCSESEVCSQSLPRRLPFRQYLGDTGDRWQHFDLHGKRPDVVLYHPDKNWLLLVEAVTSHGPMDGKRRMDLADLFQSTSCWPHRPVGSHRAQEHSPAH